MSHVLGGECSQEGLDRSLLYRKIKHKSGDRYLGRIEPSSSVIKASWLRPVLLLLLPSAARGSSYAVLSPRRATGQARDLSRKDHGHSRPPRRCAATSGRSREDVCRREGSDGPR